MGRGKIEHRGTRRRQVRPVILIVTEGSETEPKYFEHFRTRNNNIEVRVVGSRSHAGESDYNSLYRKALDYQTDNQLSLENKDSVWIVADADVNYNNPDPVNARNRQLSQLRKMAARKNIQVAISNPCFELWYLLHFRYTTRAFNSYEEVVAELRKHITNYDKAVDVYGRLEDYLGTAVDNAKRLEQYQIDNQHTYPFGVEVNPFTDVYRLVDVLAHNN